ncbi:oxygenase MpaB family protein [Kluyvera georgiana]|uniref:oxygenase MpaB family protein n=1 Tax=Kluyvera georgiana TaxID=73098 RepID=UPI0023020C0F|nr:oxygenase MpaB family protein [Kluyvera georgiana]MDA8493978.1 oxygenase MpaB family protein [Kluyvera georgiana]
MEWLRQRIEHQVLGLTGMALKEIDFEYPVGEPGLFGPQSAIWPVHGDFTSMLCGGISALLLQMLHPLALAGVWDHSSFREDIFGRLRRTSQFISATTFATEPDAERLIAKVKAIHMRISGTDVDGTPYAASDPDLLTWVHVAECSSFMASHLRYRRTVVTPARQAQYFIESASIAEKLGARNVPKTPQAVADYLEQMRPQLRCDARTREVARVLMTTRLPGRFARPAGMIFMKAGIDLLPDWAQEMLDLRLNSLEQRVVRGGVHLIAAVLRRSVRNGAYHCAMRRMQRR